MSEFYNPPINQAVHDALMASLEVKFERAGVGSDIREDVRELFNTIKEDSIRDQVSSQLDVLAASKIGVELGLFQQTQQQLSQAQETMKEAIPRLRAAQQLKQKLRQTRILLLESENNREVQQQRADNLAEVLMDMNETLKAENRTLKAENQALLSAGQTLKAENQALKKALASLDKKGEEDDDEILFVRKVVKNEKVRSSS